jgi:hypothetical protein
MLEIVSNFYLGLNSLLGLLGVKGNEFYMVWKKRHFLGVEGKFLIEKVIKYSLSFKE